MPAVEQHERGARRCARCARPGTASERQRPRPAPRARSRALASARRRARASPPPARPERRARRRAESTPSPSTSRPSAAAARPTRGGARPPRPARRSGRGGRGRRSARPRRRPQPRDGAVGLVALGHEHVPAGARRCRRAADLAADEEGRVRAEPSSAYAISARGGGLAVCAGDDDAALAARISASTSERCRTAGRARARRTSSGSVGSIALETTSSLPGEVRGVVRRRASMPSARRPSTAAAGGRSRRRATAAAQHARDPDMPTPPMPTGAARWSRPAPREASSSRATPRPHRAARSGASPRASRRGARVGAQGGNAPAELAGVERGVLDDHGAAGGGEVPRVRVLVVARRYG